MSARPRLGVVVAAVVTWRPSSSPPPRRTPRPRSRRSPWTVVDKHRFAASDVVHAAADAGDRAAQAAVPQLETPPGGDLWVLRPAAEQLDSIAG